MKKLFSLFFMLLFFAASAYASDMKFAQVDGVKFNPDDEVSVERLNSIVKDINKQKDIKFVVFSGNNISKADEEFLKAFIKKANKLKAPYYVVLGNKDVNKQKGFGKVAYTKTLKKHVKCHKKIKQPNYVFERNKNIFIVVDGSKEVITLPNGYYRPEVLSWLDEQLTKYEKKNVVIIQHYPIVPPAQKESYYTFKADEYLKMLAKHNNVKAIVAGHFGVNKEEEFNGIMHISTAEAPQYRVIDVIDYETSNPTYWSTIK